MEQDRICVGPIHPRASCSGVGIFWRALSTELDHWFERAHHRRSSFLTTPDPTALSREFPTAVSQDAGPETNKTSARQPFHGRKRAPSQRLAQENDQTDDRKTGVGSIGRRTTPLRLRHHQPARKFFLEVPCEIHTKLCACFQAQRVAVCAIEEQSNGSPARRTDKYPAHLA